MADQASNVKSQLPPKPGPEASAEEPAADKTTKMAAGSSAEKKVQAVRDAIEEKGYVHIASGTSTLKTYNRIEVYQHRAQLVYLLFNFKGGWDLLKPTAGSKIEDAVKDL